ncbi:MAG: hypothetical protein ACRC10_00305 [Thermoguttaceae bacterium]
MMLHSLSKLFVPLTLVVFLTLPTSAQISVNATAEVEQEAEQYWEKMNEHLDPFALDQFIANFPDTNRAAMAFALRYTLLVDNPNIEDYNAFLQKYPDRLQSQLALQELFMLYRDQNRAGGYLDFLKRYPDSQQALVAKLRLQTLMFEFVSHLNQVDEYDAFVETFPDAPQVPAAAQLALEKDLQDEQKEYESLQKQSEGVCERRANKLVTDWEVLVGNFGKEFSGESASSPAALVERYRIARRANTIRTIYKEFNAPSRIRSEERHQEIIAKLEGLRATLIKNNEDLIKTVKAESQRICEELKAGFEQLHRDNKEMQQLIERKFEVVEKGMLRLHDDLVTIHRDMLDIRADLKTINDSIQETNRKLDGLDKGLQGIYTELTGLRKDMNSGFQVLGEKVDLLTHEVKVQFEVTQSLQLQQIKISGEILAQTNDVKTVLSGGFAQLVRNQEIHQVLSRDTIAVMRGGFDHLKTAQERQIALAECNLRIGNDIAGNQLKTLNALVALRQDANTRKDQIVQNMKGYEKVPGAIWQSSSEAAQGNRNMVARVEQTAQRKTTLLGKVFRTAASFIPIAGPLLKRSAEKLGDVIQNNVVAVFEKIAPEAVDLARSLYNSDWEQRKNWLFEIAARLAETVGLSPEVIEKISQYVSGEDLKMACTLLASSLSGIDADILYFAANYI